MITKSHELPASRFKEEHEWSFVSKHIKDYKKSNVKQTVFKEGKRGCTFEIVDTYFKFACYCGATIMVRINTQEIIK